MSAFRFPEFSPTRGSKSVTADPEAERADELERQLAEAREDGYRAGFLAGQAEATEAHLEEQGRLTSQIVEALCDAGMTNEAARMHVAASVAPLIEQIALAIAPSLAQVGMLGEIARIVGEAIDSAPDAKPRIRCAGELATPLRQLVEERHISAEIEEASGLMPLEAQIFWDQGYDHLDLEACVAQIREVLSSHFSQDNRSEKHERIGYA